MRRAGMGMMAMLVAAVLPAHGVIAQPTAPRSVKGPVNGAVNGPVNAPVRFEQKGASVEVMGLRRWTVKMLEDSLQRYAPGQTLADAACMATLRYEMGFADALVMRYGGFDASDPNTTFVSVRVVEPRTQSLWRRLPAARYESLLPDYAPLILPVTDQRGEVWVSRLLFGLQFSDSARRERMLAGAPKEAREDYDRTIAFLAGQTTAAARTRAVRVLDSSAAPANRMAAALVLTRHADDDTALYALVRALRDPHESVRGVAEQVFRQPSTRRVDWTPVAADLRELLGGANLGAMEPLMATLVQTQIDPALAKTLIAKNGDWTLQLLQSTAPMAAGTAQRFLTALHGGTDLGRDVNAWRRWIATL